MPNFTLIFVLPYIQGDRVGICVTQFDAKQVERCLVSSPGHLPTLYGTFTYSLCMCNIHGSLVWEISPLNTLVRENFMHVSFYGIEL